MLRKIQLQFMALAFLAAAPIWADEPVLKVGDVAPDYLGRDGKSDDVRVGDYRGKVVVISFFATWCGPCRKEIPMLAEIQKVAGRDKLVVIAVDFKEEAAVVKKMRKIFTDYEITFTHDSNGKIGKRFGVDSLPNMFIVGTDGKIAAKHKGYGESSLGRIVRDINRIWRESNSPAPN